MDANELALLRSDILALLPDRCDILSLTQVSDGMGGFTDTWGTATANARCRLDPVRGREQTAGEGLRPYFTYLLTLEYSASITAANRVKHNGTTYAVTSVDADKSWPITKRAIVERV